jgi:RNA recognition motif-containing protein
MNIYVGNLSLDVTEDELKKEFMVYGKVASVTIMNDKYIGSGQPRGYGYVEMTSRPEGVLAIARLRGKKLKDRTVEVVEALPLSEKKRNNTANAKEKIRSNKSRRRLYQPA